MRTLLLLSILVTPSLADDPPGDAVDVVETYDGTLVRGSVDRLENGALTLTEADGRTRSWPVDELLSVRRAPIEPRPMRDVVVIANEDRLAARAVRADEDTLVAEWTRHDGTIDIPLETVRGVAWRLPRTRRDAEAILSRQRKSAEGGDRIVAENGDDVVGEFLGASADGVALSVSGADTTIPLTRLRLLEFDPALVSLPKAPPTSVLVQLHDGSRITAREVTIAADTLTIATTFGPRITLPRVALAGLRFTGGRAVDLSDRTPTVFEFTPWLGVDWPWQRDRAVSGGPLRLGGRTFAKGLGVHSRSRLQYDVQPGDVGFLATIGLDDTAGEQGSVTFSVLVDGREAYRSPIVRGKDTAIRIPNVDLRGAERLELLVDFADRGSLLDRANWCDAVVVRDRPQSR